MGGHLGWGIKKKLIRGSKKNYSQGIKKNYYEDQNKIIHVDRNAFVWKGSKNCLTDRIKKKLLDPDLCQKTT